MKNPHNIKFWDKSCKIDSEGPYGGWFHKFLCAIRPTFEQLFTGVERALRRAPNFDRAVCQLAPNFYEIDARSIWMKTGSSWSWSFFLHGVIKNFVNIPSSIFDLYFVLEKIWVVVTKAYSNTFQYVAKLPNKYI